MKKELLILAAVIAALSAYLVFHSDEQQNYTIPDLAKVNADDITTLAVEKNGKTVNLYRKNDTWTVSDHHYPADTDTVNKLLDVIQDLRVTALVSQSQDYVRYDLTPERAVRVTAGKGDGVLRSFEIGKTAPTNRHTFVKLSGHDGVYHAPGDFRQDFDRDVDGFRSKEVFKFDREALTSIVVERGEVRRTFFPVPPAVASAVAPGNNGDGVDSGMNGESDMDKGQGVEVDNDKGSSSWKAEDGNGVDEARLDSLVADLTHVDCESYTDGQTDNTVKGDGVPPLLKVIVALGSGEGAELFDLVIHDKTEDKEYRAASSQTADQFILDEFQGDDLIAGADAVLGIESPVGSSQ